MMVLSKAEFLISLLSTALLCSSVDAFMPSQSYASSPLMRSKKIGPLYSASTLQATNPLKSLPWVAAKERERDARRLRLERASLHRELGIAEDATYEEIVEATDKLIAMAGDDMKRKVKIEIAKDKILQIRLNERLAGLSATKEAREQSKFEDRTDKPKKIKKKAPREKYGIRGLITKPDPAWRKRQIKVWGYITLAGILSGPLKLYLQAFSVLVAIRQFQSRGLDYSGEGFSLFAGSSNPGNKAQRRQAFGLGIAVWSFSGVLSVFLIPTSLQGGQIFGFVMNNVIMAIACMYLFPRGEARKDMGM